MLEEYKSSPVWFRVLCSIIIISDKTNFFISSDIVQTTSPVWISRMALKLPLASVTLSSPEKQDDVHRLKMHIAESQSLRELQKHPRSLEFTEQSKTDNIWLNLKGFGFDYWRCLGLVEQKLFHIFVSNYFKFWITEWFSFSHKTFGRFTKR